MSKRKKKSADGFDSRAQDQREEESKGASNTKLKRSFGDAFIVVSDSDGEQESKEEHDLQKKRRTKQQLDRVKFAAKKKIAQMTEDEQFALALKMSEQEARQMNSQEEEEEELLRKAIAESLSASQVLFAEDVLEEGEPMQITQSISALTPLDSRRSPDVATENRAEEEITVCPETQPSPSQAIEPETREIHSSSKDVSLQADADEDAGGNGSAPSLPADGAISCPLCDRLFPVSKIERHATYCNGTGEDTADDAPVMTRRQKEAKSKAARGKETSQPVDTGKYEKCYVCKSLVPLKEYQRHADACLRLQSCSKGPNGIPGGRRLRCTKEEGRSKGRLLNMLEQSEQKAADAEMGATPSGAVSRCSSPEADKEPECDKDNWSHFPEPSCSDSPIKSFTCTPEAKICLVDFTKQLNVGSGSWQQTQARFRRKKI